MRIWDCGDMMEKVVHFGAGNIGRGFLGQLYFESGLETVFVEIDPQIVELLNKFQEYPLNIVDDTNSKEIVIKNVRAVNGLKSEKVADEISDARFISTAVGVSSLPKIAGPIAKGLLKRWENRNFNPINIIVCENLINSDKYLRDMISQELSAEYTKTSAGESVVYLLNEFVGISQASIGRMVPVMNEEMKEGNPLRIWSESYSEFPVDKDGFKGDIPQIKNLMPFSPFDYIIKRKIYIHNAGHAILAYLGHLKGYRFIYECIDDATINHICRFALLESGLALSKECHIPIEEITAHIDDLMRRFGNRALKDTVARVGKDPMRKLSSDDRLIGAAKLAQKHKIVPLYICLGAANAFRFNDMEDNSSKEMQNMINRDGFEEVLKQVCKLNPDEALGKRIIMYYRLKF